ncbi:MAG TPA: cation:proton antiporter [Nitrososphaeraceae archaeon]|nr:cation:proton antiporter [Nitrososphaeraceae archaeon]
MVIEIGQIIHDFAIIMTVAAVMALISFKLKQPMVIGFILAGMIIGPYTPLFNFILNVEVLNLFAEIGIILLLLIVGMEFPLEKLRKIGRKAFVIAISEALGTFVAGYIVGYYALNFSFFDSLFLALAISVTSSVLVMRVLEELNVIREEASLLILGVCVIEDIIIISMLAILQSLGSTGNLSISEIGISVGSVIAFIAAMIIVGSKIVPRVVNFIGRLNKPDLLIITILGIVFSLSYIAYEIGISIATGAFFAGVLIAESKVQVVSKVMATPIRDMFAALFFVSVGALMDITLLPIFILPAIILILVSIIAKFSAVFLAAKSQGFDRTTSIKTAFSLSSSGGELALVTAKVGSNIGVTSSFVLPMIGAMTIITTFLSPYIVKAGWKFREDLLRRRKTM